MSNGGYIPVFDSVFDGSLAGRWPTLPVWLTLLPLADADGEIDMTLQAIAARTGWPLDLLQTAIDELMKPDPHSRSDAEDGRRLVPIDPSRRWGWRVVNHAYYRELARLAAKNREEVRSGKNRIRMGERRKMAKDKTAADRREPPETASDPLLDSDVDVDVDEDREGNRERVSRNVSGNARARRTAQPVVDHCPDFGKIRKLYPPIERKGRIDWRHAEQLAQQLVERDKVTWPELEDVVIRFARFVAVGGRTPDCVESPVTFFTDEPDALWQQQWERS